MKDNPASRVAKRCGHTVNRWGMQKRHGWLDVYRHHIHHIYIHVYLLIDCCSFNYLHYFSNPFDLYNVS